MDLLVSHRKILTQLSAIKGACGQACHDGVFALLDVYVGTQSWRCASILRVVCVCAQCRHLHNKDPCYSIVQNNVAQNPVILLFVFPPSKVPDNI